MMLTTSEHDNDEDDDDADSTTVDNTLNIRSCRVLFLGQRSRLQRVSQVFVTQSKSKRKKRMFFSQSLSLTYITDRHSK